MKSVQAQLNSFNASAKAQVGFGGMGGGGFGGAYGVRNLLGGFGTGLGLMAIGRQFKEAVGDAADLNESINKVNVVFGRSAGAVRSMADEMAKSFGAIKSEMLDAAGSFGMILEAAGLSEDKVKEMSIALTKLGVDVTSLYNPVGGLNEALVRLRSGLVGEARAVRQFGVILNVGAVEAEGMRLGLTGLNDEFTAEEKVIARASIMMRELSKATGDASRTINDARPQIRKFWGDFENARTQMGEGLMPVMHEMIGYARDFGSALETAWGWWEKFATTKLGARPLQEGFWSGVGEGIRSGLRGGREMIKHPILTLGTTAEIIDKAVGGTGGIGRFQEQLQAAIDKSMGVVSGGPMGPSAADINAGVRAGVINPILGPGDVRRKQIADLMQGRMAQAVAARNQMGLGMVGALPPGGRLAESAEGEVKSLFEIGKKIQQSIGGIGSTDPEQQAKSRAAIKAMVHDMESVMNSSKRLETAKSALEAEKADLQKIVDLKKQGVPIDEETLKNANKRVEATEKEVKEREAYARFAKIVGEETAMEAIHGFSGKGLLASLLGEEESIADKQAKQTMKQKLEGTTFGAATVLQGGGGAFNIMAHEQIFSNDIAKEQLKVQEASQANLEVIATKIGTVWDKLIAMGLRTILNGANR